MRQIHQNQGFTLIEVLVTIIIFGLVIVVVYSAYTLSQQGYRQGEITAEITQNSRVILERMTREIRQAREIVTELPEEKINSPEEIVFHDGHLSSISEEDITQGGETNTITLAAAASDINDYYNDMFIKITDGVCANQIRKISSYDGASKVARIDGQWEDGTPNGSKYTIDSSYYYIRYFRDGSDIKRQIFVYYFDDDPDSYVAWDDEDEEGEPPSCLILEDQLIGEYVTTMNFWGLEFVNIFLILEKNDKTIEFETTVFGRNI